MTMRRCCGATTCYIACQQGCLNVLEYLIDVCKVDFNAKKLDGASPLYIACQYGHLECVTFLLSKGADITQIRTCGATPLFIASEFGFTEIAELLLTGLFGLEWSLVLMEYQKTQKW